MINLSKEKLKSDFALVSDLVRYNLKVIFSGKFVYFFGSAVGVYIFIVVGAMMGQNYNPSESLVYYNLLLPGILLIFYPMTFGIYNDMETRMMEMIIGIPNYRYKVWLVRLLIIWGLVFALLFLLALFSLIAITEISIFSMALQLMFPVYFIGSFAFFMASLVKNGNGAAAIVVIVGLVIWISSGILGESRWNIFLNPFLQPADLNDSVWSDMIYYNRIYLLSGILLFFLGAMYRLQKREKFI